MANIIEVVLQAKDEASGAIGKFARGLVDVKGVIVGLTAGFTLDKILGKFVDETVSSQKSVLLLQNALRGMGDEAGSSFQELNKLSEETQRFTQFSDTAARQALAFGARLGLTGDVLKQTFSSAQDLAIGTGRDLPSAMELLSRALARPQTAIRSLTAAGVELTGEQLFLIDQLDKTGKRAEAQGRILDAVKSSYGGLAQAADNTLGGALSRLKNTFNNLFVGADESSGKAVNAVNKLNDALSDHAIKDSIDTLIGSLATLAQKTVEVGVGLRIIFTGHGGNALQDASHDVEALEANIARLNEKLKSGDTQKSIFGIKFGKDTTDEIKDAIAKTTDQLLVARDALAKIEKQAADAAKKSSTDNAPTKLPTPKDTRSFEQLTSIKNISDALDAEIGKNIIRATAPLEDLASALEEVDVKSKLLADGINKIPSNVLAKLGLAKDSAADAARRETLDSLAQETHEFELQAQFGAQAADEIEKYRIQIELAAKGAKDLDDQVKRALERRTEAKDDALLRSLKDELEAQKESNIQREISINLKKLSASATDEEREAVIALTKQTIEARYATELWDAEVDNIKGAFRTFIEEGKFSLKDLLRQMLITFEEKKIFEDIDKIGNALSSALKSSGGSGIGGLLGAVGGALFGGKGSSGSSTGGSSSGFSGPRASGGQASGWTWLGEEGAELVNLGPSAQVYNRRQLQFAGSGSGAVTYAPVNQVSIVANDADETKAELIRFITQQSQKDRTEFYRVLQRNGVGPKKGLRS